MSLGGEMPVEQILPWVLLLSIVAFAAWWIFRPSARSRKTDFRVITASAVLVLMTGGFIFWQSGFRGGNSSAESPSILSLHVREQSSEPSVLAYWANLGVVNGTSFEAPPANGSGTWSFFMNLNSLPQTQAYLMDLVESASDGRRGSNESNLPAAVQNELADDRPEELLEMYGWTWRVNCPLGEGCPECSRGGPPPDCEIPPNLPPGQCHLPCEYMCIEPVSPPVAPPGGGAPGAPGGGGGGGDAPPEGSADDVGNIAVLFLGAEGAAGSDGEGSRAVVSAIVKNEVAAGSFGYDEVSLCVPAGNSQAFSEAGAEAINSSIVTMSSFPSGAAVSVNALPRLTIGACGDVEVPVSLSSLMEKFKVVVLNSLPEGEHDGLIQITPSGQGYYAHAVAALDLSGSQGQAASIPVTEAGLEDEYRRLFLNSCDAAQNARMADALKGIKEYQETQQAGIGAIVTTITGVIIVIGTTFYWVADDLTEPCWWLLDLNIPIYCGPDPKKWLENCPGLLDQTVPPEGWMICEREQPYIPGDPNDRPPIWRSQQAYEASQISERVNVGHIVEGMVRPGRYCETCNPPAGETARCGFWGRCNRGVLKCANFKPGWSANDFDYLCKGLYHDGPWPPENRDP